MENDFICMQPFFKAGKEIDMIERIYKKLTMLEMEGKFTIQRSLAPEEHRLRTDKSLSFNLNEVKKVEELADLNILSEDFS